MIDTIYRVGLLLLGIMFLFIFYQHTQNGRYQLKFEQESMAIFDTNSGRIYLPPSKDSKKWTVADPVRGDVSEVPLKRLP